MQKYISKKDLNKKKGLVYTKTIKTKKKITEITNILYLINCEHTDCGDKRLVIWTEEVSTDPEDELLFGNLEIEEGDEFTDFVQSVTGDLLICKTFTTAGEYIEGLSTSFEEEIFWKYNAR